MDDAAENRFVCSIRRQIYDYILECTSTAQLASLDCNFISVDWSKCANNCCYFGARDCAIIVGSYLEELVQALIDNGADPDGFHLLGHSLGAHLVSQVSKNGLQVGRITGIIF